MAETLNCPHSPGRCLETVAGVPSVTSHRHDSAWPSLCQERCSAVPRLLSWHGLRAAFQLRTVLLSHLPKDQDDQARTTLRAAWELEADEGMKKIRKYASWLEKEWPSAASSLREGLEEVFTVNHLSLPRALHRCLVTTNLIDSTHSGVRQRTRRVTNWSSGSMALRWAAVAFVETEKNSRRVMGYHCLWMLKARLDEDPGDRRPQSWVASSVHATPATLSDLE